MNLSWEKLWNLTFQIKLAGMMNTIVEQQGIDEEVKLEHNDERQENCLDLNEYLPENCKFDILARLPIETLCCSRFLCKSWYQITNIPDFKNAHLHRSGTSTGLIFFTMSGSSMKLKFMEIKEDGKSTTKEYNNLKIMGSITATCNGLVVLQNFCDTRGPISLLNPVTREQEYLPVSGSIISSPLGHSYGLAFCHVSRRYKLLHLFFMDDDFRGEIMEIGSGQTWRAVDVPSPGSNNNKLMIIFAMGALHWIQHVVGRGECMISMALDDEEFKTTAIPAGGGHFKSIFAMGRDQFVGFASQPHNANCRIGVWVLRGLSGEWEKQYDIDTSGLRMRKLLYCVGVGVKEGNELVFRCVSADGRFSFYAYDHRHSPQFVRKVESNDNFRGYFPHVNSLVSWRS